MQPIHRDVLYNGSSLSFVDNTPIVLAVDDILILRFEGIPNNRVPGVTFFKNNVDSPLGPFRDALQTEDHVVLKGNSGTQGTFECQAWLSPQLRGQNRPILSINRLSIQNNIVLRPAKEVGVLVSPGSPDAVVTVDINQVTIHEPDSVVWNFMFEGGLNPRDFEPLLYVDSGPSGTGPFGPFQSLSAAEVFDQLGNGILAYRLVTSGNNNVLGQYHFAVGVLKTDVVPFMEIRCIVDPVIDNSGPPNL